ncbi:MAG TPA: EVE domain-containing protein [Gemmatimonadaceae bacterium]|nr:EVE domain-containing protein [Gemmatimonadaceae bacterium]
MATAKRSYWLVKSEPTTFSFDDLLASPDRTTSWEGVRNYAARNFLRDGMRRGDQVLFYHSSTEVPAVVGICEVAREAYPDPTQFDPQSEYHDPKSRAEEPTWLMVDLRAVEALPRPLPLTELKGVTALAGMELLRRGSRLSVQPVTAAQFTAIRRLAGLR